MGKVLGVQGKGKSVNILDEVRKDLDTVFTLISPSVDFVEQSGDWNKLADIGDKVSDLLFRKCKLCPAEALIVLLTCMFALLSLIKERNNERVN